MDQSAIDRVEDCEAAGGHLLDGLAKVSASQPGRELNGAIVPRTGAAVGTCERETGLEPAQGPLLSMPAIGYFESWRILEPVAA